MPGLPSHVHYIVAGKSYILEGRDESRILKESAKKTGIESRVIFIDAPSNETRLKLLCECSLFVMPNLPVAGDVEGFGIVAIEAGVSGSVVVASALEGIKDAVTEGITGYLVEPGDANAFIRKITGLIYDVESLEKQGHAAKGYVEAHFSWERICQAYLNVFSELKND